MVEAEALEQLEVLVLVDHPQQKGVVLVVMEPHHQSRDHQQPMRVAEAVVTRQGQANRPVFLADRA